MKKIICLLALLCSSFSIFSQTKYLKGYFITNTNSKTECLIKNEDWKKNPNEFEFKIPESDEVKKESIENVKEFAIDDVCKYVRETVDIDLSAESISNLYEKREPFYEKRTIFLKLLIEGKNSLYLYESDVPTRYLFKTQNLPVKQLIYKKYLSATDNTDMYINDDFKKQLFVDLKCENNLSLSTSELNYTATSLSNFFQKVNECQGDSTSKVISKKTDTKIYFKPFIGVNSSSMDIKIGNQLKTNIPNKIGFNFGVEIEFLLPFANNQWSVFLEPTLFNYSGSVTSVNSNTLSSSTSGQPTPLNAYTFSNNASVKLNTIQIPFGGKRYIFLNDKSKININLALNYIKSSNSSELVVNNRTYSLAGNYFNMVTGLGYTYNKFTVDFKYFLGNEFNQIPEVPNSYVFKNMSLVFKYRL